VIGTDGHHLRQVKVQGLSCGSGIGCHEPHWSPDGAKIIFADTLGGGGGNLYTVNTDGTGLTQVTHDGHDDNPAWGTHPPKQ
jgi:Tol biopolymer transport system component